MVCDESNEEGRCVRGEVDAIKLGEGMWSRGPQWSGCDRGRKVGEMEGEGGVVSAGQP